MLQIFHTKIQKNELYPFDILIEINLYFNLEKHWYHQDKVEGETLIAPWVEITSVCCLFSSSFLKLNAILSKLENTKILKYWNTKMQRKIRLVSVEYQLSQANRHLVTSWKPVAIACTPPSRAPSSDIPYHPNRYHTV